MCAWVWYHIVFVGWCIPLLRLLIHWSQRCCSHFMPSGNLSCLWTQFVAAKMSHDSFVVGCWDCALAFSLFHFSFWTCWVCTLAFSNWVCSLAFSFWSCSWVCALAFSNFCFEFVHWHSWIFILSLRALTFSMSHAFIVHFLFSMHFVYSYFRTRGLGYRSSGTSLRTTLGLESKMFASPLVRWLSFSHMLGISIYCDDVQTRVVSILVELPLHDSTYVGNVSYPLPPWRCKTIHPENCSDCPLWWWRWWWLAKGHHKYRIHALCCLSAAVLFVRACVAPCSAGFSARESERQR